MTFDGAPFAGGRVGSHQTKTNMNTNEQITVEVAPVCDGWAVFGPGSGLSGAEWARFHTEREANEWAQEQGYVVADLRFAPAPLDNHAKRVDTAPGYVE